MRRGDSSSKKAKPPSQTLSTKAGELDREGPLPVGKPGGLGFRERTPSP